MNVFTFLSRHALTLLLALGALFTYIWLRKCRTRLDIPRPGALVLSLLHVVVGVCSVKLFAVLEAFGNPDAVGNMSLFGGVFFMPLFYWCAAKVTKRKVADVFDVFTICLVFTLLCARVNCILSGCCQGAFIPGTALRFPTRELELAFYVVLLFWLGRCVLTGAKRGEIYPLYMMSYGIFRAITECFRASDSPLGIFHLAHIWSLLSLCIGAGIYFELRKREKRGGRYHG